MVFWTGDSFDYTIPFRQTLAEMVELLGGPTHASLDLPPYFDGEECVEGTLKFGNLSIRIYYEYMLAYLALSSDSRDALSDAAARVLPSIQAC